MAALLDYFFQNLEHVLHMDTFISHALKVTRTYLIFLII